MGNQKKSQTSFQRAYKAGIRISAGSDTLRVLKHGENAAEIVALVKAGMSEMEALASATIHGADALGVGHLVGSINEGKLADLIVVDPNPLNDISLLCHRKNLKIIIKNGDVIISKFESYQVHWPLKLDERCSWPMEMSEMLIGGKICKKKGRRQ